MTVDDDERERLSQDQDQDQENHHHHQYQYEYSYTDIESASASSSPYTSVAPSTDTSPASAYSEQLDRPAYPSHPHSHPQTQTARQYYPSSPYETYNREHSYFGPLFSTPTSSSVSSHRSRPLTRSTDTSTTRRLRLTLADLAHFLRPKLRIRQRKMPLSRRGRTCFCVVLPLLAGTLLFLSTFPAQVPWVADRSAEYSEAGGQSGGEGEGGGGPGWRSSAWGVWEEGSDARDWLSAVLGKGKVGNQGMGQVSASVDKGA